MVGVIFCISGVSVGIELLVLMLGIWLVVGCDVDSVSISIVSKSGCNMFIIFVVSLDVKERLVLCLVVLFWFSFVELVMVW